MSDLNCPGLHLLDKFSEQINFMEYGITRSEGVTANYMQQLDASLTQAMRDPECVYTAMDTSLPLEGKFQAISGALVCCGHEQLAQITWVSGQTTAPDAELFAISLGVLRCLREENVSRISVYTDSIASARKALDPSVHSEQSVSLAVCKGLDTWLSGDPECKVYFTAVPSKEKWPFYTIFHDMVTNFPQVAYSSKPACVMLDHVQKDKVEKALDEWRQLFSKLSYRGHHFLPLTKDRKVISPTYFNLGPWLSGEENLEDPKLFAHFCRCILGHAPINEY